MPLVPRPPTTNASKGPSTGGTPTGDKAIRQRKKDSEIPVPKPVVQYPSVDWDEVDDVVEHVVDVVGKISHSQMGTTGNVVSSINCPTAYAHATLEAHLASRDSMVYIRIYKISHEFFREKMARMAYDAAQKEQELADQLQRFSEDGYQEVMFET